MSNAWDEGNDEYPAEAENESQGLAQLRKAFDRQKKQNEEYKAQLAQFEARDRERTISETLSAKGLNSKLAKFFPAGEEATTENVDKWLTENADVFGVEQPESPNVSEELKRAYEQFQQPVSNAPNQGLVDQIANFSMENQGDYDKFLSFMRNNPGAVHNPGF